MPESLVQLDAHARVAQLLSKAHALASHAAPNTLRSYMADWEDFCEFAPSIGVSALPAEPASVACYLAERAGNLRAATLGRRLSGIAFYHAEPVLTRPLTIRRSAPFSRASSAKSAPRRRSSARC